MDRSLAKTVAKAIFYASIQASIGSVEMSSKFSVMNFSKDQETLQRAADALKSYMIVGMIWTVGTMLALYASNGWCGASVGLGANVVMMGWIIISYMKAFRDAAERYNLEVPTLFTKRDWVWAIVSIVIMVGGLWYLRSKDNGSREDGPRSARTSSSRLSANEDD
jgi:hypothetical protein